jgi:hypothetical protein
MDLSCWFFPLFPARLTSCCHSINRLLEGLPFPPISHGD